MPATRHEPNSLSVIESSDEFQETKPLFEKAGWIPFLEKFNGYDTEIALQFANTFDGLLTVIKGTQLVITEELISQALELPCMSEKWFKGKTMVKNTFNQLLIPEYQDAYWSHGITKAWLLDEWGKALYVIQKFVTSEGRFDSLYIYHA